MVLKLSYEGGLVPAGFAFVNTPALVVSGDGHVYTQGVVPAIYPGPLLPSVLVRSITEPGVQLLLGVLDKAGLLAAEPDYSSGNSGSTVADAPVTVLAINAAGSTFEHRAYALGIGNPETAARKTLLDAITAIGDPDVAAGAANLGPDEPFAPAAYRFRALAVDPADLTSQDLPPTIVEWPSGAGVPLTSATTCATVDAATVGSLFTDAKQNTYFRDADVVYQVTVAGVLPGDPSC